MAKYRIQSPDGQAFEITAPDDATPDQVHSFAAQQIASMGTPSKAPEEPGVLASLGAAAGEGFGRTVLGAQHWLGRGIQSLGEAATPDEQTLSGLVTGSKKRGAIQSAGDWLVNDAAAGRKKIAGEVAPYEEAHPVAAGIGRVGGEIVGTLPVGGALAAPVKALARVAPAAAPRLAPLAEAISSSGMSAPGLTGVKALLTRAAGGAATGAATGALVNPDGGALPGAVVGGVAPGVVALAGKAGSVLGDAVRPLYKRGQERIVGDALRRFSTNPDALRNLQAAGEVIPGSAPTALMAAGDEGLAGLGRTMQAVNPEYAAELAARSTAQNAARTTALQEAAGNAGKLAAAREARDAATGPMREQVLDAAGALPAQPILDRLDSMLRNPSNAGRISQQALKNVRDQIAGFVDDAGAVHARALYAIRKDINDVLGGKLQGEAGNLRYASGQLIGAKDLIDSAIDQASRAVPQSPSRALAAPASKVAMPGTAAAAGPRAAWRQYLDTYSQHSVPINQMELLDDVMKRVQSGTVDAQGNLVLSAAKLNGIMKNEGQDLMKKLAPEQIDLLRRLAADLNASQLAQNSGRAVGSDTVQKLASAGAMQSALGQRVGGSSVVQTTLARPVNWLYKNADQQVTGQLGQALLDPREAARLMADPTKANAIAALFGPPAARLGYRAAPLLAAQ